MYCMLIMLFIIAQIGLPNEAYQLDLMKDKIGAFSSKIEDAYVSRTSWRLIYYYDLNGFYENIESYKECLNQMDEVCSHLETGNDTQLCKVLIVQHRNFLTEMNLDIEYLELMRQDDAKEGRKRRKREAPLGYATTWIFKPLFGVLDEQEANEIVERINTLTIKQNGFHTILEDNLSIIRRTIETSSDSMDEFQNGMNQLSSYIDEAMLQLKNLEEEVKMHLNFQYISELAKNIQTEYVKSITLIKKVLRNKLFGEYTEFTTYHRVMEDLKLVTEDVDDTRTMILTRPRELQQSIEVYGTIMDKKLLIELSIPMVDKNIYSLNKIIPLPIRNGNEVIVLEIPYVDHLVQNDTKVFIPLSSEDLHHCKRISKKKLLCKPRRETHTVDKSSCEFSILFNKDPTSLISNCQFKRLENQNYIIGLNENSYFFSPNGDTVVKEQCHRESPVDSIINKIGILKLDTNCVLTIDKIKLYPFLVKTRDGIWDLPSINRSLGISLRDFKGLSKRLTNLPPAPRTVYFNHNDAFTRLLNDTDSAKKRLDDIKTTKLIQKNIMIDGLWSVGTALFLFAIVYVLFRCCCK